MDPSASPAPSLVEGSWPGGRFAALVERRTQAGPVVTDRVHVLPVEGLFAIVEILRGHIPADESLARDLLEALRQPQPGTLPRIARRIVAASHAAVARPRFREDHGASLAVVEIEDGWAAVSRLGATSVFHARKSEGAESLVRVTESDDIRRMARRRGSPVEELPREAEHAVVTWLDPRVRRPIEELEVVHRRVSPGDRLVLIGDRIVRRTTHAAMAAILARPDATPSETCEALAALPTEEIHGDTVVLVVELA